MATGELKLVIEKLSRETAKSTEKILQYFRDVCESDAEFSQRMRIIQDVDQPPDITQYYFDKIPVFYSEMKIENYQVKVTFNQGYYR